MKRAVTAILIAIAVLVAAGTIYAQAKPPATVTLAKNAKLGPVTFNHAKHQAMAGVECTQCHATKAGGKVKEGMFHPTKPAPAMSGGCIDCHKKPANTKAPKACTGCHKKAA